MKRIRDIGTKKWWAVGAISLAAIAFSLDLTVLNLALPTLSTALHASTNQLQWIADAYALALAVLTLPAGLLGDRFGRKKFMLIALLIFGAASAACAYSTSVSMLITSRILLGVGAAFILPLGMSVMPVFFRKDELPKALAILMGGVFLAYPLGPILGGWLLTHFWWGSVFLINIPVVLLALVAISLLLPENKSTHPHKMDVGGVLTSSLGLTGITFGAIQAESKGWGSSQVLASLIAGALTLVIFFIWERMVTRRGKQPLVDMQLFSSRGFTWGTLLMTSVNFSLFGLLFGMPQYLEGVRGENALAAGYRLLPMIGGLMIGSVVVGKLSKKINIKLAVAFGFAIMATGLILGTRTTMQSSDAAIIIWSGVIGLGLGVAMPTVATAAVSQLSADRSGVGTALISAIRQVGGTLGIALLGTLLGATYRSKLNNVNVPHQLSDTVHSSITGGVAVAEKLKSPELLTTVRSAFVHGLDVMLWVSAAIAATAVILALIFMPSRASTDEVKQL